MKYVISGLVGAVLGGVIVFFILWQQMPSQMLTIHESPYGLEKTVQEIESRVQAAGWKMPKVYNLQKSLAEDGYDIPGIRIFSLCNPHHASKLLGESDTRFVSAMMPCRIAVYEHEGTTRIASMNIELMSGMFGGEIERVMSAVAAEEKQMLGELLAKQVD